MEVGSEGYVRGEGKEGKDGWSRDPGYVCLVTRTIAIEAGGGGVRGVGCGITDMDSNIHYMLLSGPGGSEFPRAKRMRASLQRVVLVE